MAGPRLVLFSYGAMQPDADLGHRLGPVRWSQPATLPMHRLYDSGLGWPFAAPSPTPAEVHGTLVELDTDEPERRLAEWDDVHGFDPADKQGSLFLRVRLLFRDRQLRRCTWLYISNPDRVVERRPAAVPAPIASGDWRAHRGAPARPVV